MWKSRAGYTGSVVVRQVAYTDTFSKVTLEVAYGKEMNILISGNISGGHSCSKNANYMLSQNLRHLRHCVV